MSDANRGNKPNLPPGLDAVLIACGFDALSWDFLDQPIFELRYENGATLALHRGQDERPYDVPDGITANRTYEASGTEVMIFKGVRCIDEDKFRQSINASVEAYGAQAKVASSLVKYSKVETDDKLTTTTVGYYKTIYRLRRDKFDNLSSAFREDLKGLPSSHNSDNRGQFDDFFRKWGTHFLTTGFFGGIWVMNTIIEESVFDRLNKEDVKTSVEAGFSAGTAKASGKDEIEQNTMKSLHLDSKSSKITFHSVGGNSNKEIREWLISVDDIMVFLKDALCMTSDATRPIFAPIWQLADKSYKATLKQAWSEYLPPDKQQDEILPQAVPGQVGTNVQAATDGFLCVLLNVLPGNDFVSDCSDVHAFTDASPDPKTWIASAGVDRGNRNPHNNHPLSSIMVNQNSMFAPIRRGDYYRVGHVRRRGNSSANVTFQPFQLGFGAWEALSFDQLYSGRDKDGFVLATVWDAFVAASYVDIIGWQAVKGILTPCAGSSVGGFPNGDPDVDDWPTEDILSASFCMPVVKGSDFRIDLKPDKFAGLQTFKAFAIWMPMESSHHFLPLDLYKANVVNQAHTNGIVTGYLSCPEARSTELPFNSATLPVSLTIQTAPTQDFVNPSTGGLATVQSPGRGKDVAYNSATTVVAKGSWFRVSTASQSTDYSATVGWFGIVAG